MALSYSFTTIADSSLVVGKPITQSIMQGLMHNLVHLKEALYGSYTAAAEHDHDGVNSAPINLAGQNLFLQDNGTGANGNVTVASNATWNTGLYDFDNLTINSSVTLDFDGEGPVILRCTDTFTLNGTLDGSGPTRASPPLGILPFAGGGAGGQVGLGSSTPGSVPPQEVRDMVLAQPFGWEGGQLSTGQMGGRFIVVIAPNIVLGASASIDCSGQNASSGGGGGVIILVYDGTTGGFTDGTSGAYDDVTGGTGSPAGAPGWSTEIDREAA